MPAVAEEACAEGKHGLCAVSGPTHASVFQILLNQRFGCGFDGTATDGEAVFVIGSVMHTSPIFPQVSDRLLDFGWGIGGSPQR